MTTPIEPPQQPAEDWTAEEAAAAALYLTLITAWLAAVTGAVFPAAGIVNPFGILAATSLWTDTVANWVRQAVIPALRAPYEFLFGRERARVLFDQRPFVDQYIRTVQNLLSRVPDETFRRVQAIVQTASTDGTSIPDTAAQIRETLLDAGAPYWTNRAETIARTELLRAHRGGSWDSYVTYGAENGIRLRKTWIDSDDARVRPAHVDTDEQTVPIMEPFQVGTTGGPRFPAMYPGDPALPPNLSINCRCDVLYTTYDEPLTDLSDRRFRSAL
jgi:uncharacterized protein with gpF-like domain